MFFVGSLLFFRAGPWGTPSDHGPNPMGYPSWARFLDHFLNDFWLVYRPNLTYVSGCSAGWAGGVTRSVKNYIFFTFFGGPKIKKRRIFFQKPEVPSHAPALSRLSWRETFFGVR